ncbi:twitchin-like [Saccostrea echinata]|uniref:twitchin-like n=1 Tax=Saccostrea echinata TaxID=191078 RepID=UPI002A818589|nr:twitchin-like [Saccostrea echinata]XP_061190625.1 twitchin-like [Saccostrea echinata]
MSVFMRGLKKDKEYNFHIQAKNLEGFSESSDVIGPITPKPKYTKVLPPGVPEAVNNSITYLKWEPPKHNGGCKITDYLVEERFKGAEMWCKCNEYPCTDPSLLSPIFLRTQSGSLELQLLTLLENVSPVCAHQHTKSRRRLSLLQLSRMRNHTNHCK